MFRYVNGAPASIDGNVRLDYKSIFFAAVTYRHGDAIALAAGFDIKKRFTLGYSYDYTTSNLANYSSGTHGIIAGFRLVRNGMTTQRQYFW